MNEVKTEEVKKIEVIKNRKTLMTLTLKELELLEIDLKDVFSIKGTTLNFSWEKLIRLINYLAKKTVLRYDHTFEEAIEVIGIFLA